MFKTTLKAVKVFACAFPFALSLLGCQAHKTQPAQAPQEQAVRRPATLDEERFMLEEEKRELVGNYSENLERIQQINARIIEINIIQRQGSPGN